MAFRDGGSYGAEETEWPSVRGGGDRLESVNDLEIPGESVRRCLWTLCRKFYLM